MRPTGSDRARPDAQILAGLYEQLYDRIARYVTARTGNRDVGEDLAGEILELRIGRPRQGEERVRE